MPDERIKIRRATMDDARAVHDVVLPALRDTNARDYPASVIDRLMLTLPERIASNLQTWHAYVAIVGDRVVGTGSLNGEFVKSVFVHPEYQRRGVATALMNAVEDAALAQSVRVLNVQSSVTAKPFYATRGYAIVREEPDGDDPAIVMAKVLSPAPM